MSDLDHWIGADLAVSASGDVLAADGTREGQQRVLRRLLTNPGDYRWHPDYGAGLASHIGTLLDADALRALIRSQLALESIVARTPAPDIQLRPLPDGVAVRISYHDTQAARPVVLAFDLAP